MVEPKPDVSEHKPVKRSRRNSSSSNSETKDHTSSSDSLAVKNPDFKSSKGSISKYAPRGASRDDKHAIVTRNRSLGIVNGVSTKVDLPLVPYGSTLRRLEKRKQVKELNEDDYVACMENIIERDYFPDLLKYRYLKAISDAEKAGNKRLASNLERELEMIKSGQIENNVYLKTLGDENVLVNLGKDGLKLDEFNRIFSSEDNRSFDHLMEKDIQGKIAKTKWMEDSEYRHNLALADVQKSTNLGIRSGGLQTNKFEARNSLYFTPDSSVPDRKSGTIIPKNTNLGLDEKDLEKMSEMQSRRREELRERLADEKLSDLIAAEGVSKNKDLVKSSARASSYVFTPKIVAGESEPIFTWGTISSVESIPATPLPESEEGEVGVGGLVDRVQRHLRGDKSVREGKEFSMPRAPEREEIANNLYKKLKTAKTPKTPLNPNTPFTPKTPLIVQKLIAKHTKNVDVQLRDSYSVKKYKSSKASSVSSRK